MLAEGEVQHLAAPVTDLAPEDLAAAAMQYHPELVKQVLQIPAEVEVPRVLQEHKAQVAQVAQAL